MSDTSIKNAISLFNGYSVTCKNCGLMDEYLAVLNNGPHAASLYCQGCDRWIEHISKAKFKRLTNPVNVGCNIKMGQIISARIDVTKIDKAKLFAGEKGTYLDITLLMKDEKDQYGNNGMVVQQVSKEERAAGVKGAILGNAKILSSGGGNSEASPTEGATSSAATPKAAPSNLPF